MSCANLTRLDLTQVKWIPCAEFDYSKNALEEEKYTSESKLNPCENLKSIKLSTRLGSQSAIGIVLKYAPPENQNALFALKVIPGTLKDINIQREIVTSIFLSDIKYYPKFYGYGECLNVLFPEEKIPVPGVYIVYELLSFDLRQLLSRDYPISEKELTTLILDIFNIFEDLYKRNIIHPDTHTGNIMFRCLSKTEIEPVVIDFGSCVPPNELLYKYFPKDKKKFSSKISVDPTSGYKQFLNTFLSEVNKSKYPNLFKALHKLSLLNLTDIYEYKKRFIELIAIK